MFFLSEYGYYVLGSLSELLEGRKTAESTFHLYMTQLFNKFADLISKGPRILTEKVCFSGSTLAFIQEVCGCS
jgi:hypothetical protein